MRCDPIVSIRLPMLSLGPMVFVSRCGFLDPGPPSTAGYVSIGFYTGLPTRRRLPEVLSGCFWLSGSLHSSLWLDAAGPSSLISDWNASPPVGAREGQESPGRGADQNYAPARASSPATFHRSFFRSRGMCLENRRLDSVRLHNSNRALRLFVCFACFASFQQLSNRAISLLVLTLLELGGYPEDIPHTPLVDPPDFAGRQGCAVHLWRLHQSQSTSPTAEHQPPRVSLDLPSWTQTEDKALSRCSLRPSTTRSTTYLTNTSIWTLPLVVTATKT